MDIKTAVDALIAKHGGVRAGGDIYKTAGPLCGSGSATTPENGDA